MIRDYEEGARIIIDDKCFEKIEEYQKSKISGRPYEKYMSTIKSILNIEGIVTKKFNNYEISVTWNVTYNRSYDGKNQTTTTVQVKNDWVKPLDDKWKKIDE